MEITLNLTPEELPLYLAETDENLLVLDEMFVEMEGKEPQDDHLQAAFRAAHTLKGLAGVINHDRMVHLTHGLETALDGLRKRQYSLNPTLMNICLDTIDNLRLLREEVYTGKPAEVDVEELVARFQEFHAGDIKPEPAKDKLPAFPEITVTHNAPENGLHPVWISAQIDDSCIVPSARAFQLMMLLQELGEIQVMEPDQQAIEAMTTKRSFAAVIMTTRSLDDLRQQLGSISEVQKVQVSAEQPHEAEPHAETHEAAPAHPQAVVEQQPAPASTGKNGVKQPLPNTQMVRTSVQRLDQLVNLVGELITDRNRLNQIRNRMNAERSGDVTVEQLSETVAHLARITDQLQEEAMHLRMMPIGSVLNKFPRLVRDLAQKLGKDVRLVLKGEDTELDRSVIEEISDPLIHLVRNAVDHGIEAPEDRLALGKTAYGVITLTAMHDQGHFILTIEDNGRGIDTNGLRRKAVDKGLISEEEAAALPDDKALELMYLPGISTAKVVTDNSGRGVGMDIVRNNIQRINGTVLVESELGKGTCIRIILPLTLAIVSSLMTRVCGTTYAIPLVMVSETLRVNRSSLQSVLGRPVTLSRGALLPLVDVSKTFKYQEKETKSPDVWIVVVWSGRQQLGLVVDELIGKEEVVIKSLGSLIGEITGISGAAILGDGEIALILDVPGLLRSAGVV